MKRLLDFYRQRFGNHFFLRLMIIYFAIIILLVSLMTVVIIENVKTLLTDQAVHHNMQALETINNHFENQNKDLKKILSGLYSDSMGSVIGNGNAIENLFNKAEVQDLTFSDQSDIRRKLDKYLMEYGLPIDNDINDLLLVSPDSDYLASSRNRSSYSTSHYYQQISSEVTKASLNDKNINSQRMHFLSPSDFQDNSFAPKVYVLYDYIRKSENTSEFNGFLAAVYSPDFIKTEYNQFSPYLLGDILILTEDNRVIFDSSNQYYDTLPAELDQYQPFYTGTRNMGSSIVNTITNREYGYSVVGMISSVELDQYASRLNVLIFVITGIGISLILALGYINTKRLLGRILTINNTLTEIEQGNLNARAELPGSNDEIKQIATNLNHMSEKLQEHIQKEYTVQLERTNAELKQKTAELYALQTQIDPHFLYNTLEAIRMGAVKTQDKETADMIKVLAKLFRSSAKGGLAITIQEELAYCKAYLSLFNIRYQERFTVEWDIAPDVLEAGILKHLIQPIIENTIMHGLDLSCGNNRITITGKREQDFLVITVCDSGKGMPEDQLAQMRENLETLNQMDYGKIGLYNVQNRIRMIYGNPCGLSVESVEGIGTRVTMKILALTKEELLQDVQGTGS